MNAIIKAILVRAKEVISDPVHWTKGANARDIYGTALPRVSSGTYSFCALGAIGVASDGAPDDVVQTAMNILGFARGDGRLTCSDYNDDPKRTHAEVMAWFDRAIKAEEDKP